MRHLTFNFRVLIAIYITIANAKPGSIGLFAPSDRIQSFSFGVPSHLDFPVVLRGMEILDTSNDTALQFRPVWVRQLYDVGCKSYRDDPSRNCTSACTDTKILFGSLSTL